MIKNSDTMPCLSISILNSVFFNEIKDHGKEFMKITNELNE